MTSGVLICSDLRFRVWDVSLSIGRFGIFFLGGGFSALGFFVRVFGSCGPWESFQSLRRFSLVL